MGPPFYRGVGESSRPRQSHKLEIGGANPSPATNLVWSVRLSVRTLGFHPKKRSSILLRSSSLLRGSYSGNTSAFQADAESSILLPRSICIEDLLWHMKQVRVHHPVHIAYRTRSMQTVGMLSLVAINKKTTQEQVRTSFKMC